MSFRASYDFHSPNYSYLKACFVKVIDIVLINTELSYYLTYKRELSAYNLRIFLEYSLPILRPIKCYFKLI
jgi:hypothetical protein